MNQKHFLLTLENGLNAKIFKLNEVRSKLDTVAKGTFDCWEENK
jgi:hypothetical protein